MTAALGLPVALFLGAIAAAVSGLVRRVAGGGASWWPELQGVARDVRLVTRGGKERPTMLETGGAVASLFGSALAADAALGAVPGSMALVYLALLAGAAGGHVAAVDASTVLRERVLGRARSVWAIAEPAFVLGLVASLARWRAGDLDAVRGAQEVLGAGPSVGPPLAAAGLAGAVAVLVVAGALRMVPPTEAVRGRGRRAGGALLIAVSRWSLAGATSLVAAVLLVGGALLTPDGAAPVGGQALPFAAVALGVAVLVGLVDGLATLFARRRNLVAFAAVVLAAAAAAAVAAA